MTLQVNGLTVRSDRGHEILSDVALSIAPGECVAIVGESGAGKSVLARTLLGITQASPGWSVHATQFAVTGRDMLRASQRTWRSLRGSSVSLIMQDALQSLDPLRTIGAEVGETLAVKAVPRRERPSLVRRALEASGLHNAAASMKRRSTELSGGQRQRALIASALVGEPQLVIADEPTTALDTTTADRVLQTLRDVTTRGTAVLLITHDIESVATIADRVVVLAGGRVVETGPTAQLLARPQHEITRRLVASIPRGPKPAADAPIASAAAQPLLSLRDITKQYPAADGPAVALNGVSIDLLAGEALGIIGESGAGKTTLARIITGAERPDCGVIEPATVHPGPRIRLIPQDPMSTFDPRWSVERIVQTSNRLHGVTWQNLLERVGLDPQLGARTPRSLSGGQRQRVAIARALAAAPDVLVCDEPVSALDVATQAGILTLLRGLQHDTGVTLVFVTHDLAVARTVCDRLAVMQAGEIVETGATEELFARPRHAFTKQLLAARYAA